MAQYTGVRYVRPNYLRIDQVGPGDTYVLYFDGSSGWEILPDHSFADLAGDELRFPRGYAGGLNLNSWLADREPENVFISAAPNVVVIATKDDASHKTEITLGPDFLPTKETSISFADSNHPVSNQTMVFEQWEATGSVKFPRRRTNFHFDKKVAEIMTDKIGLNKGITSSELAKRPSDSTPVMCSQ